MLVSLLFLFVGASFDLLFAAIVLTIIFCVWFLMANHSFFFYADSLFYSDGLSINLAILSVWVSVLMLVRSYGIIKFNEGRLIFFLLVWLLILILVVTFFIQDLLYFYFFFECSLIPTLIIIVGWGYQPERLQAGLYFIFYTLTASLPLLFILLSVNISLTSSVSLICLFTSLRGLVESGVSYLIYVMFILAFLVKLPMYFTHL